MTLNAKIGVFMDFWRFWAARHISRANCAEINWDRHGKAVYEIFSIEHTGWSKKNKVNDTIILQPYVIESCGFQQNVPKVSKVILFCTFQFPAAITKNI